MCDMWCMWCVMRAANVHAAFEIQPDDYHWQRLICVTCCLCNCCIHFCRWASQVPFIQSGPSICHGIAPCNLTQVTLNHSLHLIHAGHSHSSTSSLALSSRLSQVGHIPYQTQTTIMRVAFLMTPERGSAQSENICLGTQCTLKSWRATIQGQGQCLILYVFSLAWWQQLRTKDLVSITWSSSRWAPLPILSPQLMFQFLSHHSPAQVKECRCGPENPRSNSVTYLLVMFSFGLIFFYLNLSLSLLADYIRLPRSLYLVLTPYHPNHWLSLVLSSGWLLIVLSV